MAHPVAAPARTAPARTRRAALVDLLRDAARLDRTQSDPVVSLRNAVGVAAPLAIGALAGSAAFGLPSTVGALQTAFADRPGPYRLRFLRMATTAAAAGLTSGLAMLLSHSAGESALLLLATAFVAGLLVAEGPAATQVGIASVGCELVIGHTPEPPSVALHVGLLVFAGGLGQAVLAVLGWPLGRHRPERRALAGLYRGLAQLAREPIGTHVGPPLGEVLETTRQTLYGLGHDHGPSVEAYRVLLDEAERIRGELIVLAGQVERLERREERPAAAAVRDVLGEVAVVLGEVAAALDDGRPATAADLAPVRARVEAAVAQLDDAGPAGRAVAARVRALTGQLRAAVETARTGAAEGGHDEPGDLRSGVARLRAPIAILRANLSPRSIVFRHAVRIAVLVAGTDLACRLANVDRGYWVPLTVLVTLRPDFAGTFQRAFMRVLGTFVGLVLATVLVHFVPGGQWWSVALVLAFYFGLRFAGPGNIALLATSLGALVVVLLELSGVPAHSTLDIRSADTAIGGALALLGALLWPSWQRGQVPDRLVALVASYRRYLALLADPDVDEQRLGPARTAARLARSNAQASVDAARAEPVRSGGTVELGEAVLVHTHRFVHALLTVDAVRAGLHEAGMVPELRELLLRSDELLAGVGEALATLRPPRRAPKLRPVQEAFAVAVRGRPDRLGGPETTDALLYATDRIANSLDTLVAELRRQLERRAPAPALTPTG